MIPSTEPVPVRGRADRKLRVALGSLLGALLVVLAASTIPRKAAGLTSSRPGPAVAHGSIPATSPPTRATASPPSTTAAPRASAGSGCGLSLRRSVGTAAVGNCTVLEIGDSLGNDLAWGIARHLAAGSGLMMDQLDRSASGLANSGFYNWPVQLVALLGEYHPQLVIISIGGDDEQGILVDGSEAEFGSPAWRSAYLARARQLVNEATASGAYVLWVGMPIMAQQAFSQGMQVINELDSQAVASDPNATFLSVWSLMSNPEGQFQADAVVNGNSTALRQADGIHYSYAGEDVIATYVIGQMATIYHVDLAPQDPVSITRWN